MRAIRRISGQAIPLGMKNVDTDIILPANYLKTITRQGLGGVAFESIRAQAGNIFDRPQYRGATIIVAGDNFGCGSSREHAVWALVDMGIEVIIAPSFSDIFSGNAFKNGLLAIVLPQAAADRLLVAADHGPFTIDLEAQCVVTFGGEAIPFEFDAFRKHCLLNGLDEIGLTLAEEDSIATFEARVAREQPWLPAA